MIRAVVAIDEKRGMAGEHGIPWQRKLPTDSQHFLDCLKTGKILMGYGTYAELEKPFHNRTNYVASSKDETLKPGFEVVNDANKFLEEATEDVWVIGGPGLLAQTIDNIEELSITQLKGDFHTTKFFPEFQNDFELVSSSDWIVENDIPIQFQTWHRK